MVYGLLTYTSAHYLLYLLIDITAASHSPLLADCGVCKEGNIHTHLKWFAENHILQMGLDFTTKAPHMKDVVKPLTSMFSDL